MLTSLQTRIAELVSELPEAREFALAGGAALIVHGTVDRQTADLDFFTPNRGDVAELLPRLEAALSTAGLAVTREQVAESFARLSVTDGSSTTLVDLGWDYRLRDPIDTALGRVLAEEELGADKLLALHGRAEPRDFVDVEQLAARYGLPRLCELAALKDRGFSVDALAQMMGRFERLQRADFDVDDTSYRRLQDSVSAWRLALENRLDQGIEPPGLGL